LNIAGISAVAVALIHMTMPDYCKNCGSDAISIWHAVSAFILFGCMAFVAWFCTERTLGDLDKENRDWFRRRYDLIAGLMVVAPIAAVAASYILGLKHWGLLIVEALGVWTFSAYWLLRSYELYFSHAEWSAMVGQAPTRAEASSENDSWRKRKLSSLEEWNEKVALRARAAGAALKNTMPGVRV
jgi:hypothetical protein